MGSDREADQRKIFFVKASVRRQVFFSNLRLLSFVGRSDVYGYRPSFHRMEVNMPNAAPLEIFVQCLNNVSDPRSKQGVSQPFQTALTIVFLGLGGSVVAVGTVLGV